ncbi:flagellar basal body rod protein FlgB [Fodinicurvata fenggangensis]|uniref:flagellar basal body rod protein FlgB n=1 Tax=Fodinicurvata fenggangensis TaxID=1121830 RepID=UPI00068EDCF4|nr:flagellar basal body rod protein FlgB [Fodinicurvata fenggangensis]
MSDKFALFDVFAKRMDWLSQRQSVLSQNIANADTPGYVSQDLKEGSFERMLQGRNLLMQTTATHSGHMSGTRDLGPGQQVRQDEVRDRYETVPSGNSVVVENELGKIADTQMHYSTVTNLYSKYTQMYKMAAGGGGSR